LASDKTICLTFKLVVQGSSVYEDVLPASLSIFELGRNKEREREISNDVIFSARASMRYSTQNEEMAV